MNLKFDQNRLEPTYKHPYPKYTCQLQIIKIKDKVNKNNNDSFY